MSLGSFLENVTTAIAAHWPTCLGGDEKLGALDRGILEVALMVAALDGTILPEEYASFERLARTCRGNTEKNVRACLDRALRAGGYLMAMAQVGAYTPEERVAAFVEAAADALPGGFDEGTPADVRRAFALWVAMGVSDGEFSDIERKAVEELVRHFSSIRQLKAASAAAASMSYAAYRPITTADSPILASTISLLEADFLENAERIVRDFAVTEKREAAEVALEALISAR